MGAIVINPSGIHQLGNCEYNDDGQDGDGNGDENDDKMMLRLRQDRSDDDGITIFKR